MPQFRLSTLLLVALTVSAALGWYADRTRLRRKLQSQQPSIATYWEKHAYWSPSAHLGTNTSEQESRLEELVVEFSGPVIESSQGMSPHVELRQPSRETIEAVVPLLDSPDLSTRQTAGRLLALYLEAVSGHENTDYQSIATRGYLHARLQGTIGTLLSDKDAELREAAAYIAGNFYYSQQLERQLINAFEEETDGGVKYALAWAYYHARN